MSNKSLYNRFHDGEDVEFNPGCFEQGSEARGNNFDQYSQNPYERGTWAFQSYCAGWCDMDMALAERDNPMFNEVEVIK